MSSLWRFRLCLTGYRPASPGHRLCCCDNGPPIRVQDSSRLYNPFTEYGPSILVHVHGNTDCLESVQQITLTRTCELSETAIKHANSCCLASHSCSTWSGSQSSIHALSTLCFVFDMFSWENRRYEEMMRVTCERSHLVDESVHHK